MSTIFYAVTTLLLVAGVSYLAYLSHIPEPYIVAIATIMLGIGVMNAVEDARQKHSDW